jgi:hypothetical protein
VTIVLAVLLTASSVAALSLRSSDPAPAPASAVDAASRTAAHPRPVRRGAPVPADPQAAVLERRASVPLEMWPSVQKARALAARAAAAARAARAEAARKAARKAAAVRAARAAAAARTAPFDVTIGTFNVLGSQHTAPGGDRQNYPPASVRSPAAAGLIAAHHVSILGTQELQDDQLRALQSRTGFAAYPGMAWGVKETDNSILWDPDRFELVSGSKFIIPFMGRPRPQPIVRLRYRATGREFYVVNTHPSAHDGRYLVERRRGQDTLVGVLAQLKATGLPVLVTGDMNDREEFYCRVVARAGLTASNGGGDGCHPPPAPLNVDWLAGSDVTWSGHWRDISPGPRKISDHFFISATAHVG